jgi:hypothetical protein
VNRDEKAADLVEQAENDASRRPRGKVDAHSPSALERWTALVAPPAVRASDLSPSMPSDRSRASGHARMTATLPACAVAASRSDRSVLRTSHVRIRDAAGVCHVGSEAAIRTWSGRRPPASLSRSSLKTPHASAPVDLLTAQTRRQERFEPHFRMQISEEGERAYGGV